MALIHAHRSAFFALQRIGSWIKKSFAVPIGASLVCRFYVS
jgi:hypothetical protein